MEDWRTIQGFERYEVSNMGNIRRGCKILKPGLDTYGYRQINLYNGGKRQTKKIYRLVLEAFVPNKENKPQIDHINRIRTDDKLENLRWVTSSENCRNKEGFTEDMYGIGWSSKNSKYTVRLYVNGKETYFGSCSTIEEAQLLRNNAISGKVSFVPQKDREMYGITNVKDKPYYAIKINNKTIGYKHTLEEAKVLRDNYLNTNNNEDS
jgi:hypothetical protein